ncbi:MAG: AI-2E family transporter [Dysosmobacter welbionis]
MEWNKQKIKGLLLVVCGGVAFYCALQRLDAVLAALGWLLGILAPFLLGGALAFILNVPMRAIERHLFPRNQKGAKLRRPLALVLTLVAVIGVLALAGLVIGPGIADAVMSIIREIPAAFQRLEHQLTALAENLQDLWPLLEEQLMKLRRRSNGSFLPRLWRSPRQLGPGLSPPVGSSAVWSAVSAPLSSA